MAARDRLVVLASASLLASLVAVVPAAPAAAVLPAPVILNGGTQNGAGAQWVESQSQPDDGGTSVKQFVATLLVQHPVGRVITQVRLDADFDGVDDSATGTAVGVTEQTYVASAGRIETSRVTVFFTLAKPAVFTCSGGLGVRTADAPVRLRVVDSTGEQSTTASTIVRFVEDLNCLGVQDYPRLLFVSQTATEVTPGQDIAFSFACSDPDVDVFSSDDDCDRARIRWRRLDDGATSTPVLKAGMDDDVNQVHVMALPAQGYYVVEAQLGNENGSFPDTDGATGGWWRLGNAVVNDSASSLSGSLSFSGASGSVPPSVNEASGTIDAVASVADAGGAIQVIEWDSTNDGSFERREYTVPVNEAGVISHPSLTAPELTQSISTATPGLVTVRARITDNGALDAADNIRRQLSFSGQLRINARPTASDVAVQAQEDTPLTISLAGADTDAQPATLTYEIVSGPAAGAGVLGPVSGNQVEFTPAENFVGSTSFTYAVRDGGPSTVGAWATSTR